jgi:hypothetical protein
MAATPDRYQGYALTVLLAFDAFVNALFGGRLYDTISARVGRSILFGGWAARVPWPGFARRHFLWAADAAG